MSRTALPTLPQLQHGARTPRSSWSGYQLSFHSHGSSWRVLVTARNLESAVEEGLIELASQFAEFDPDDARLIACVMVR